MARVAIDCEMVGDIFNHSMVARVSIVNGSCTTLYDTFVKPTREVGNYRTPITGLAPYHLQNGKNFNTVQREVVKLINGNLLIGHSVAVDLEVLSLTLPSHQICDIAELPQYKRSNGQKRTLKSLAKEFLDKDIQVDYHDSLEDAETAMELYNLTIGGCVLL